MKKNLFIFLLVPIMSIAMDGGSERPGVGRSTPNSNERRKSVLLRSQQRLLQQEPTTEIRQGSAQKKIPSDGQPALPDILRVSGELALGRLSEEEFRSAEKKTGSPLSRRKSVILPGEAKFDSK